MQHLARTTLNGEGLQHQDGHSHIMAGTIPNCRSYDPCFSYELETIISEGIEDMYVKNNDRYYYITLMNENYTHPKRPETATPENILKGAYCFFKAKNLFLEFSIRADLKLSHLMHKKIRRFWNRARDMVSN